MSTTTTALTRNLGLRDLVIMGLLLIGALAPVSVFGPIDAHSNGAVALVYLVACVAMGLTAASYAQMARVVPRAGSVFAYATAAIGPRTGFIAGWMILLDYMLVPGLCYLVTGLAMNSFLPWIPVWVFTLAALIITTALNLLGARLASRVGSIVIIAEAILLAAIVIGAIIFLTNVGPTRGWATPFTGVGDFDMSGVLLGVSVAILSFLGFDAIASFAEENAGRPSLIGKATIICLALVGVLFVVQVYLGALISPISPAELNADPSLQGATYYNAVESSIGEWVSVALGVVKAVGAAFAAMVGLAAGSRLIFGMARAGRLPRTLSSVAPKTGTPVNATLFSAVLTMAIAIPASLFGEGLSVLSSVINVGALTAFLILHVSVFAYFRRDGHGFRVLPHLIAPLAGAIVVIAILLSSSHIAQIVGAVWLLVGLVVTLAQRGKAFDPLAEHSVDTAPEKTTA